MDETVKVGAIYRRKKDGKLVIVDGAYPDSVEKCVIWKNMRTPSYGECKITYFEKNYEKVEGNKRDNSMEPTISTRGKRWLAFAHKVVLNHVENYTIPQYGDAPDDNVEGWTADQCMDQIGKYHKRFRKGQRGKEEQLRDMVKISHFSQLAYDKLLKEEEKR